VPGQGTSVHAFAETVIAFIEQNQQWFLVIMIFFAAAENLAFLSIIIPSTPVLAAVGALSATGALSFWSLWVGASIGALIGSTFSYWLGWRYGDLVLGAWPLRNHPEMVQKTQVAFTKYGAATIMIGHFVTIFRPVVFLMAGISRMNPARFMVWNVIGSLAWAYIVPKVGEVGGLIIGWVWSFF
jgi:membrane protein DedA with SNARE-associated domain